MGLRVYWDGQDNSILRWEYDLTWSEQEALECAMTSRTWLAERFPQGIDMIVDFGNVETLPKYMLTGSRPYNPEVPKNWGITVYIAHHQGLKTLLQLLRDVKSEFSVTIQFAETIEDAREIIWKYRSQTEI